MKGSEKMEQRSAAAQIKSIGIYLLSTCGIVTVVMGLSSMLLF